MERAEPYPGAVSTVNGWRAAGHWILVASHRSATAHDATARWLAAVGMTYDELHCSYDKLAHCLERDVALLIDDSPDTLAAALQLGLAAATLRHPWNRALCEAEPRIVCADDWARLHDGLAPAVTPRDEGQA